MAGKRIAMVGGVAGRASAATRTQEQSSATAVAREYTRLAPHYDRRWPFYIQAVLSKTREQFEIRASDRLLDVGCGTGSLLHGIASESPAVKLVGVDLSLAMLNVANRKLGTSTVLLAATAQRLPFRADSFDVVVSCSAFHYWREPETCVSEMARILKPGGQVVITDWCDDYLACRLYDVFLRVVNRAHFKTYGRRECERLLLAAGLANVRVERYKISRWWGLMTAYGERANSAL